MKEEDVYYDFIFYFVLFGLFIRGGGVLCVLGALDLELEIVTGRNSRERTYERGGDPCVLFVCLC